MTEKMISDERKAELDAMPDEHSAASRIDELLFANNLYLARARIAENRLKAVEEERGRANRNRDMYQGQCERQAQTLADLRAELVRKEDERAEQWRMRREAEGSRDAARAACDTLRAALDKVSPSAVFHLSDRQIEAAAEEFTDYFRRNYPGPDTIIGRPEWHSPKIFRAALHAIRGAAQAEPAEESHLDNLAVDRFAAAMKAKLERKRAEGRGGWDNREECSAEHLTYLLIQHCLKGDPLDVGNLAMMLHQRGDRIVIDGETASIMQRPEHYGEAEPVAYRYRFADPISGNPVWRFSSGPWNGQKPEESQPLYTAPLVRAIKGAVDQLFADAKAEAEKAKRKYPQPNYIISKVAEEAGEVVKAAIHCAEGRESAENVVAEIRQAMAMLIRLFDEGDQVHGLPPLGGKS